MPNFSKQLLVRIFVRDRLVFVNCIIALSLQFITWVVLLWQGLVLRTSELLPLHYTIYFGIDRLGAWYEIFVPVLLGFLVFLINSIVIALVYEKQRFFAYVFVLGTVFVELVVLAASFFILFLNS